MTPRDLILSRMQNLLALGLEGTPASGVIPRTADVWVKHLSIYSVERLAVAFDRVEETASRWPSLAAVKDAIPPKVEHRTGNVTPIDRSMPDSVRTAIEKLAQQFKRG